MVKLNCNDQNILQYLNLYIGNVLKKEGFQELLSHLILQVFAEMYQIQNS